MPYFTTAELRALPDMNDTARFPDAKLTEAHDWIVAVIERECETSFIVKTATNERRSGGGVDYLRLQNAYARTVSAVTVDSGVYTAGQVAALLVEDGYLYQADGVTWPATARGNVLVTYTYGYAEAPPADLKQAALRGARNWLLSQHAWSGVESRATSISNGDGTFTIATPGEDRPTGWPDVDATIIAWRERVRVPKVA